MKFSGRRWLIVGIGLLISFIIWTILIQVIDVQPVGLNGTDIGFAALNVRFHRLTGVHMALYTVTDWLGLIPVMICMVFAVLGLVQLIKRKSLFKVDHDIILLGVYYLILFAGYLIFEMIPINYRPVLIDGVQEASYPSSTTLLVLGVMSALCFQAERRIRRPAPKRIIITVSILFSLFMVLGRTVAGVHWLTDILGSVLLSTGLFSIYSAAVILIDAKCAARTEESRWNSTKSCRN